jgi:hypothetical protein
VFPQDEARKASIMIAGILNEADCDDFIVGPFLNKSSCGGQPEFIPAIRGRCQKVSEVLVIKTAGIDTAV